MRDYLELGATYLKLGAALVLYKLYELDQKWHFCSECGAEKVDAWGRGQAWFSPIAKRPRHGLGLTPTEEYPIVETETCSTCGAVLSEKRKSTVKTEGDSE